MKGTTRKINSPEGGLLNFLASLTRIALPLMKNMHKLLAKSVLVSLRLTAAVSAADAAIPNKIFELATTIIISNEEINDIMKIVKFLKESDLLIKGVSETIKNEAKERKVGFIGMLLGTLAASLLRSALADKGVIWAGEGSIAMSWGQVTISAGQNFLCHLIL